LLIGQQVVERVEAIVLQQDALEVQLDRTRLVEQSEFLQREILVVVWKSQNWPEQAMGFEQWTRLVDCIENKATVCMPGNIRVDSTDDVVRLKRLPQSQ